MRGCIDREEPECTGSWCLDWGLCIGSLDMMHEDSSLRRDFLCELKKKHGKVPQKYRTAWRRFLKAKKKGLQEKCTQRV